MAINFLPGHEDDTERSKRKPRVEQDFEYTQGEVVTEGAAPKKKAPKQRETKNSKNKKKQKKATKATEQPKAKPEKKAGHSFLEWRKHKEQSAQEKAEAEERARREREEQEKERDAKRQAADAKKLAKHLKKEAPAAPKHKREDSENSKEEAQEQIEQEAPTVSYSLAPEHEQEELPDLLHGEPGSVPTNLQQPTHAPEPHDEVHTKPVEQPTVDRTVYTLPPQAFTDEAPDLMNVRGEQADERQVKKIAKKEAKAKGKKLRDIWPDAKKRGKKKRKHKKRNPFNDNELDTSTLEVNLLPPEVLAEVQTSNKLRDLAYTSLVFVGVVLMIYAGINFYSRKIAGDTDLVREQLQQVETEIARYTGLQRESIDLDQRLSAVTEVLEAHIYWTPFLEELEAMTLPTVYYTQMGGSATTGEFALDIIAANYSQIDPQIKLFEASPYVKEVSMSAATQASLSDEESDQGSSDTTAATAETTETENTTTDASALTTEVASPVQFSVSVLFDTAIFHPGEEPTDDTKR